MVTADQPIYVRNGAINFNRRDEDERDPKIVTYDDYITELKEALIRKDASLDEINLIRQNTAHAPSIAHPLLTRVCSVVVCRERMNVVLESLAGCLSERIMEDDGKGNVTEPRLSYLRSCTRVRRPSSPSSSPYLTTRALRCVGLCTSVEGQVFEAAVVGHGTGRVPHLPLLHHVPEEPEEVKSRTSELTPFRQHTHNTTYTAQITQGNTIDSPVIILS